MKRRKFKRPLSRQIDLAIREMRDGCLQCRLLRGLCHEHYKVALRLALEPRKTLKELGL